MSELIGSLTSALERRLRGPVVSAALEKFDIDPKRYWLLMDLFRKLSNRDEMQSQLGRQFYALRFSTGVFLFLSGSGAVLAFIFQARAIALMGVMLALTAFSLVAVLLSESANSLVNPDEALALAHQPINGATYTAAKLSHLLSIGLHYVVGWNLLPAAVSPILDG